MSLTALIRKYTVPVLFSTTLSGGCADEPSSSDLPYCTRCSVTDISGNTSLNDLACPNNMHCEQTSLGIHCVPDGNSFSYQCDPALLNPNRI